MVARIKKNDTVVVLNGKDKGRRGTVIEIFPKKNKVIVKDCALAVRHVKARKQGEVGGIKKQEAYLAMSQIMPICVSCNKPCRINAQMSQEGVRVRVCNRCKKIF